MFGTTNHSYWNLSGGGSIADHELSAPGVGVVDVDDELIPTGTISKVEGTPFDFSTATALTAVVDSGGIDHCLVFAANGASARLYDPGSGRVLTMTSNQPGLQVYTGQYLPVPYAGLCLEPQQLPDTANNAHFGTSLLRPDERYEHRVVYDFSTVTPS